MRINPVKDRATWLAENPYWKWDFQEIRLDVKHYEQMDHPVVIGLI